MRRLAFALIALVAGCADVTDSLNRTTNELVYGDAALAGTLAPYPQSSGCNDDRCIALDRTEAQLYAAARMGRINWVQLVDGFYQKRAELFPSVRDTASVRELRAYQRMLAEQMDQRKLTETQWVYLNERKQNELRAR